MRTCTEVQPGRQPRQYSQSKMYSGCTPRERHFASAASYALKLYVPHPPALFSTLPHDMSRRTMRKAAAAMSSSESLPLHSFAWKLTPQPSPARFVAPGTPTGKRGGTAIAGDVGGFSLLQSG